MHYFIFRGTLPTGVYIWFILLLAVIVKPGFAQVVEADVAEASDCPACGVEENGNLTPGQYPDDTTYKFMIGEELEHTCGCLTWGQVWSHWLETGRMMA